ncbi:TIGR03663 family protein [Coraliomargarita algicola]|uniref:TIGR03663 family protein n=1 Tax=Coraliomargarita algicola TaxID=3092156 RepID=A0ABZ0RTC1_9BACT|nr:flippase activity-associated protein Agl23 [Coraliomargarita sp. J2-16]WPJ96214.1 TIGR03663 family protein [Coraliomargarita sp. J2-16]
MKKDPLIYLAWLVVLIFAVWLRTDDLGTRPMHADEATGARILAQQLEGDDYVFDPQHFHGPILTQITRPIAALRGEHEWTQLNAQTLRSSTVIAGILLVFTPLLWLRFMGKWGALGAAALLATSPLLVYYSRMYIHESWLTLFGMLACASLYQVTLKPNTLRAIAAGLSIGLMFATKETFAISILSWAPAVILLYILQRYSTSLGTPAHSYHTYLRSYAIITLVALASAGLFYSNYLRNPAQFIDAFRTFFEYQTTAGHEKAFGYYLKLLVWPQREAGIAWPEGLILILATTCLVRCIIQCKSPTCCWFLGLSALVHLLIYSCIQYKTPWLMLLPWAHVCLLAGFALQSIKPSGKALKSILLLLFTIGLGHQTNQCLLINGRLANSTRNPYAYVPTSADAPKLAHWLQQLDAMHPLGTLAVVGKEYWPLPWYLKQLGSQIGYWPTPIPEMTTFPVVLAMPEQQLATQTQLQATHTELPRSLRANVPVILYLRKDLWQQWQQAPQP